MEMVEEKKEKENEENDIKEENKNEIIEENENEKNEENKNEIIQDNKVDNKKEEGKINDLNKFIDEKLGELFFFC